MHIAWNRRPGRGGTPPRGRGPRRWHLATMATASVTMAVTAISVPGAAASGPAKPGRAAGPGLVSCGPPRVLPLTLCYTPGEYQTAYGVAPLLASGIDGSGETVLMPELANTLADQQAGRHLGFVNPAIYRIARSAAYHRAFHDVVTGDNSVMVASGVVVGYQAGPGWDPVTGWGSPNAQILVPLLAHGGHPGGAAHS